LRAFVVERSLGIAVLAPFPVRLRPGLLREPDIVFLARSRHVARNVAEGADLVIEVLSPGSQNRQRDLVSKRREYAEAKIAEYWLVDPEAETIQVLASAADVYVERGSFHPGERATSGLLAGFQVEVSKVFAEGQLPGEGQNSPMG
jgi:Uma2 family endonuclease